MKSHYVAPAAQVSVEQAESSAAEAGRAPRGADAGAYQERTRPQFRLTAREREVLALLCAGLPNKLISRALGISGSTTKCHVAKILQELGVTSRLQAVVWARRYRLLGDGAPAVPASPQADNA